MLLRKVCKPDHLTYGTAGPTNRRLTTVPSKLRNDIFEFAASSLLSLSSTGFLCSLAKRKPRSIGNQYGRKGEKLRAVSTLLAGDERRDNVAESIVKRARCEGQVDNMVMAQLRLASLSEMYESLTGVKFGDEVRLRDFQGGWIGNVREQYRRTR